MPLRKVPNTEDNEKWIIDLTLVWTIVNHITNYIMIIALFVLIV